MPSSNEAKARIAVLGGGITGLAVAYTLARAREGGAPFEELLIEADGRLGGSILTECVEGFVVEAGPDSFLAEKPGSLVSPIRSSARMTVSAAPTSFIEAASYRFPTA